MTADQRERIRQAISAHKHGERARIIAMGKGEGRCVGCGERHEDYNPGCQKCRDRKRLRAVKDASKVNR